MLEASVNFSSCIKELHGCSYRLWMFGHAGQLTWDSADLNWLNLLICNMVSELVSVHWSDKVQKWMLTAYANNTQKFISFSIKYMIYRWQHLRHRRENAESLIWALGNRFTNWSHCPSGRNTLCWEPTFSFQQHSNDAAFRSCGSYR